MTLKDFREKHPEAAAELEAEARAAVKASGAAATPPSPATTPAAPSAGADDPARAERARIQEIDAVAQLFPSDVVQAAKYGDHPCTAKEMAYQVAVKAAKEGGKFLAALEADTSGSGAQEVGAANGAGGDGLGGDGGENNPQAMAAQAKKDAAAFNQKKKEVR